MESGSHAGAAAMPAHARLVQMGIGYWVSRIVYAAAKLRLADHLAAGSQSATELAAVTQTHAPSLYRLMRALAGIGVLSEDDQHRFSLTSLGEALKTGAPGSARSTILALGGQCWWRGWEQFDYSLVTGSTGMQKAFGMNLFEYLASHPEDASHFNEAMIGFHGDEPPAVAAAGNFSRFGTVVDVGGGTGTLLAAILLRHPNVRGILAELPHVVDEARLLFEGQGLLDRVNIEPIDFFKSVPAGGDAYLLSHVIHDWTESQCLSILNNCRHAMHANARLLIVETVIPAGNTPHPGKLLDIAMLVMPGGQERSAEEYGRLLTEAGFRLERVVPTDSSASIIEAIPVS
jgi:hypothetical protein